MKKIKIILTVLLFLAVSIPAFAQTPDNNFEGAAPELIRPEEFYRAEVLDVYQADKEISPGYFEKTEVVKLKLLNGPQKGQDIEADNLSFSQSQQNNGNSIKKGNVVIVSKIYNAEGYFYYIVDRYRLPVLIWLFVAFFLLAIAFARFKGFTSILGLAFSIFVLAGFIVPKILSGHNPLLITLAGSAVIAIVAIYLAHGFNKRASLALLSTLITLGIATLLSVIFVKLSQLFGLGSEEAFYLQGVTEVAINLQGLLLSGIIIGTLGVLDDITASQTAAVDEIHKANKSLGWRELYKRGLSVGHEHIAALINTLALAYAGASLPLFLLFTTNQNNPLWIILNSELVAEELVRTLVGSIALIFAVPISTFFAAYFLTKNSKDKTVVG